MKLNLGCGDRYADGWTNVDHEGSPHHKDVALNLAQSTAPLPWSAGSVTHIYAGHVLEHLSIADCGDLLVRLLPLMAPGGQIMVVGPDLIKAEMMIDAGTFDFRWGHTLDSLRHGGHRWPGDEHLWECNAAIVAMMLDRAGWSGVSDVGIEHVPAGWPVADRAPLWQCAVSAVSAVSAAGAPTLSVEVSA